MLPETWTKKQADDFDKAESARLFAESAGIQRPRLTISQAVVRYMDERCPDLKNGSGVIAELDLCKAAYKNRAIEELPDVAREYAEKMMGKLAPATIRNRLAYLRAACRYGFKFHNMCERDPAERMQMPVVKNERHEYASRKQVLSIARHMTSRAARVCLWVGLFQRDAAGRNPALQDRCRMFSA